MKHPVVHRTFNSWASKSIVIHSDRRGTKHMIGAVGYFVNTHSSLLLMYYRIIPIWCKFLISIFISVGCCYSLLNVWPQKQLVLCRKDNRGKFVRLLWVTTKNCSRCCHLGLGLKWTYAIPLSQKGLFPQTIIFAKIPITVKKRRSILRRKGEKDTSCTKRANLFPGFYMLLTNEFLECNFLTEIKLSF